MVTKLNRVQTLTKDQQDRSKIAVAASGLTMADGLAQDPMLAQVRLRNGDIVYVKDLPAIDRNDPQPNGDYQIPLVNDHTGNVKDQGGASWLFVEDDMLHALTLYSDNSVGNDLLPLANDGVLQFSTEGWVEDVDEDGKYGDFLLTTLSPVTVGNDPGTQVLNDNRILITNAFRSETKGEKVATPTKKTVSSTAKNDLTPADMQGIEAIVQKAVVAALKQEDTEETTEDPATNDVDETEETTDESVEETDEETQEEEEEAVATNKLSTTPKAPVSNKAPKQPVVKMKNDLSGDGAMHAFNAAIGQALLDNSGQSGVRAAMNVYKAKNNITGDAILPDQIASTFFQAWLDNDNLAWARFMNAKAGAVYAEETTDTAKGAAKGDTKTGQTITMKRRDLKALAVYKKLIIDKQDIFDDQSGQLIKLRAQELSSRIQNQILVAALLGSTQEGSVGSTAGAGVRGLFGIVPDSAASGTSFGAQVASAVTGTLNEDSYHAVTRLIGSIVKTTGGNVTSGGRNSDGVTLFVPWAAGGNSWLTKLLLQTSSVTGAYLFPAGSNLEALLRISRIIEVPELAATNQLIAVVDGAYQLYGENNPQMYPFFDTTNNTDVLLAEQFIAGSLAGYKQAAVYTPYAGS